MLATIVSKIKSAIVNGKINLTWMFVLNNVLSIRDNVKKGLNCKFYENKTLLVCVCLPVVSNVHV